MNVYDPVWSHTRSENYPRRWWGEHLSRKDMADQIRRFKKRGEDWTAIVPGLLYEVTEDTRNMYHLVDG